MVEKTKKQSAVIILEKLLGFAWYLGIIFGILLIGGLAFFLIADPGWLGESMRLQIETPGLVFIFTSGYSMPAAETIFRFQFALILPFLVIGLLVIYHLRKIFATLAGGDPFSKGNSRRIKTIGWLVITATVFKAVLSFLFGLYFMNFISLPGLILEANIRLEDFSGVFAGIIILILAEVFKYGSLLQEEQNLTV